MIKQILFFVILVVMSLARTSMEMSKVERKLHRHHNHEISVCIPSKSSCRFFLTMIAAQKNANAGLIMIKNAAETQL